MDKKIALVVVDMQNDFIDGALGSKDAQAIVPNVIKLIKENKFNDIIVTYDTHHDNYFDTLEGKKLPVMHCEAYKNGWMLNKDILNALEGKSFTPFEKPTFGEPKVAEYIRNEKFDEVIICGLVTSICVVSNALLIRAFNPNLSIKVKSDCCAGIARDDHEAALKTMQMCQIDVI